MSADVRVGRVHVEDIRFHPHNIRRDLGDLRSLADSISRYGVMQPVVLEQNCDHYRLRAGHRRVAAARLAGLARIPALIHVEMLDDDEWLIHSVQENVMRRGLDADERADVINALREHECTWTGIAEAFGVTQATIKKWADPHAEQPPKKHLPNVKARTFGNFARAWREHAATHPVTVDDVLDALDQIAATGGIRAAMPPSDQPTQLHAVPAQQAAS